jgi:hypothetical protein
VHKGDEVLMLRDANGIRQFEHRFGHPAPGQRKNL